MSGTGPESVPSSADPRSRRPTKKRALDARAQLGAHVDALFAKPDREIRIPSSSSSSAPASRRAAPPEIVAHVQGSSAGAGSGEFHVYKAARRREYERLREIDNEVRRDRANEAFERDKKERDQRDAERTRKNRDRREKTKARKANRVRGPDPAKAKSPLPNGPSAAPAPQETNGRSATESRPDPQLADDAASPRQGEIVSAPDIEPVGIVIHDNDDD